MLWEIIKMLFKQEQQLSQFQEELKGLKTTMSDLSTKQDTLDADIQKVADVQTQQGVKLAADDKAIVDATALNASLTAERDTLKASNVVLTTEQAAEVARLDTSIAALEKLIPAATAPAPSDPNTPPAGTSAAP